MKSEIIFIQLFVTGTCTKSSNQTMK